jgi:hypothetical protein
MRTTLNIDDDVLQAARQLADATGETIGEAISRLARAALVTRQVPKIRNGIKLLPIGPDRPVVTSDDVDRLRDELP